MVIGSTGGEMGSVDCWKTVDTELNNVKEGSWSTSIYGKQETKDLAKFIQVLLNTHFTGNLPILPR